MFFYYCETMVVSISQLNFYLNVIMTKVMVIGQTMPVDFFLGQSCSKQLAGTHRRFLEIQGNDVLVGEQSNSHHILLRYDGKSRTWKDQKVNVAMNAWLPQARYLWIVAFSGYPNTIFLFRRSRFGLSASPPLLRRITSRAPNCQSWVKRGIQEHEGMQKTALYPL